MKHIKTYLQKVARFIHDNRLIVSICFLLNAVLTYIFDFQVRPGYLTIFFTIPWLTIGLIRLYFFDPTEFGVSVEKYVKSRNRMSICMMVFFCSLLIMDISYLLGIATHTEVLRREMQEWINEATNSPY